MSSQASPALLTCRQTAPTAVGQPFKSDSDEGRCTEIIKWDFMVFRQSINIVHFRHKRYLRMKRPISKPASLVSGKE